MAMKRLKIVFLATHQWQIEELWEPKAKTMAKNYNFDVEVCHRDELDDSRVKKILRDCDGLITTWGSPLCSSEFIKQYAPNIKIIGHAAGSVAAIADESTYNTGVKIISANSVMAQGVAEWSLLATLLAVRNFGAYTAWNGMSKMNFSEAYNMSDIQNATIGLWGMGDTSKHLLKLLAPLNPGRIIVASEHSSANKIAQFGGEKQSFETVLRESDMLHALVGVNSMTFERFGEKEFAMLKKGSTFINCGRAHLVQEKALLDILKSKQINAILDVFHKEPLPEDSPYYELDNIVLTPHNAGFPGRDRFIPFLFKEFEKFFSGTEIASNISKSRFFTMTNESIKCTA
jgi:phosphoglycerate dehydrogenase-like enzyme